MKFKSRLYSNRIIATIIGTLVLAGSAFAAEQSPKSCPALSAIRAEGMSNAIELVEGIYLTYNLSYYDTTTNWGFIIGPVKANTDERALRQSNKLLTIMTGSPKPEEDNEGNWICEYQTGNPDISAFAINTDDMISPRNMIRYLRRSH